HPVRRTDPRAKPYQVMLPGISIIMYVAGENDHCSYSSILAEASTPRRGPVSWGPSLNTAVVASPGEELAEAAALAPEEREKTRGACGLGFRTEKCLHAPSQVRTFPGPQAIAPRQLPVTTQHAQHLRRESSR